LAGATSSIIIVPVKPLALNGTLGNVFDPSPNDHHWGPQARKKRNELLS
jgi:hypothetical protein